MKKISFILFCVISLFSCVKKKNRIKKEKKIEKHVIITQNDYSFKIYYANVDKEYSSLDSMEIEYNKKKQYINLLTKKIQYKTSSISYIQFYTNYDFNFDGYNDIYFLPSSLPDFNYRSLHFLYNDSTKLFVESNALDSLYNVEVLTKKKEICTSYFYYKRGYGRLSKYIWKNDSLVNINKIEVKEEDDGVFHLSVKKNNKIIISDSIVDSKFMEKLNCKNNY